MPPTVMATRTPNLTRFPKHTPMFRLIPLVSILWYIPPHSQQKKKSLLIARPRGVRTI